MSISTTKYASRKFIVTVIVLLLDLGISIYSLNKIKEAEHLSSIITTSIMWMGIVASTYIGGNTVVNWTNNKTNGQKQENIISDITDTYNP